MFNPFSLFGFLLFFGGMACFQVAVVGFCDWFCVFNCCNMFWFFIANKKIVCFLNLLLSNLIDNTMNGFNNLLLINIHEFAWVHCCTIADHIVFNLFKIIKITTHSYSVSTELAFEWLKIKQR